MVDIARNQLMALGTGLLSSVAVRVGLATAYVVGTGRWGGRS